MNNLRVCLIGSSGGLGSHLGGHFHQVTGLSSLDLDIRDRKKVSEYFDKNEFDVVINLAGKNFDSMIHKISEESDYFTHNSIDVNIKGAINIASACLPGMRKRGFGRLIYASSVLSTKNVLGTGVYSASKAFIDRFVQAVSAENASKGVTCNSIRLGYFEKGMTDKLKNPEIVKGQIPMNRFGTIEELYMTIEFLIKNEYVTGTAIEINGGVQ